jgi:hypothetical protein
MVLHSTLIELLVIKRAEVTRKTSEVPNKRGLSRDSIGVIRKGRRLAES